jgi:hypothetical protein
VVPPPAAAIAASDDDAERITADRKGYFNAGYAEMFRQLRELSELQKAPTKRQRGALRARANTAPCVFLVFARINSNLR